MGKDIINWQLLIPLLVTAVVAVSGWIVGHRLNAERDLQNKRIELRIKYLLEAYRNLESSVETEVSRENLTILESAISDIQLLGTPEQVDKVLSWSSQFSKTGTQKDVNLQDLLEDLRSSLRRELGLRKINKRIHHVKFTLASDAKKTLDAEWIGSSLTNAVNWGCYRPARYRIIELVQQRLYYLVRINELPGDKTGLLWTMVPKVGVEPTPPCEDRILNPARLPIPPLLAVDGLHSFLFTDGSVMKNMLE